MSETNKYEYEGRSISIEWHHDESMGEPWKEHDGHGIVSEWTRRDKQPGERVLCSDRNSYRYYDFAGTMKLAKSEGWGLDTKAQIALAQKLGRELKPGDILAASVEADFEYLRRWCNDDWHWCGYVCKINGTDYDESLWGIDSDSQKEFEAEALEAAKQWLDNELEQSHQAACADVVTI